MEMCERGLCSKRRCSDCDFKTLLNNSLQLHSALTKAKSKHGFVKPFTVASYVSFYTF